ncbi:MAG TPA: aminotransferase class I/II-fold pyridoxal phosphate-dependent enzyme [bacterium]|nr:aminotransferase class I/II-fold pyridoxal phosphate-dependent enzyme [bacterium]
MTPGRAHGADVYAQDGRPRRLRDFSSTVASLRPPSGLAARAAALMPRLGLYPQPHSLGLAAAIERRLKLPQGCVLVGNGSSECLEWMAQAARGQRVWVEQPCFGEYLPMLRRAGARPLTLAPARLGTRGALAPAAKGLGPGWLWLADPANPSGLSLAWDDLAALLSRGRRQGLGLVVDEALSAQQMAPRPALAGLAASRPGLVLVRSLGKGLGLPGLRLGYLVAHPRQVRALRPFTRPWNVNSLAQALGPWLLEAEARRLPALRRDLAGRKADLLRRLAPLAAQGLRALPSDSGAFLVELPRGASAERLAARLESAGFLVRPCHSYGAWGRRCLRLNPRTPQDNRALASALARLLQRPA